jgi:hypothetical protein
MVILPLACWSQENTILEGVVVNDGGKPIPYAHIQIKNKAVGVSANEQGEFRFIFPASSKHDTLLISSIGYCSVARIISSFETNLFQTIPLKETSTILKEIVVKDVSAATILRFAIERMEEHFDQDRYTMESFFRIAVRKDSAYIGLLDAAIDIHDPGFKRKGGLGADLLQLRKVVYTDNWLPGNSLSFRSPAVSIEEEFGKRIRGGILNYSRAMKFWNLEMDDPLQKDSILYYVLKASPKRYAVYYPYYFANLVIRAEDYAIVQISYDYQDNLINFAKQFPAAHPYGGYMADKTLLHFDAIKGEFTFSEYNNKLYLSRAFYEETGRLSNENLNVDFAYQGSFEIFVNRIFNGRTGQASTPISKHDDIFKLTDLYDSAFWSNYNKPISTQLYEKAISSMAKNGDLNEQFKHYTSLQNSGKKEYVLTQQKQSEHFVFNFAPSDSTVIDTIAVTLESNYQRIIQDLHANDQPIVTVKIYPSLAAYHVSIGNRKAPAWMIGSSWGADEFRIVSPLNPGPSHTYESVLQAMVHELTHCVHADITDEKIPVRWLWESIACYEAGQFHDPSKLTYIKNRKFPTLKEVSVDTERGYVYELGYVLIKYIKENWGQEKLNQLLRSNGDLNTILGISEAKFEENFYNYVTNNYLKNTD